jgi:acetylornithine aminotransferase
MTLAKALAGGAPIGAMLARNDVAAAFSPGTHGSTFGGNPLVCAAALATIRTILEENLLAHTMEMGAFLLAELGTLAKKYPFVTGVRGIGLMIGMSLTIPAADIVKKGHELGVLLNVVHDTVLRFVPPLIVTQQDVRQMITILDGILAEVEA